MIPVLFNGDAEYFETNGIGFLTDTKKCKVTEERNGEYTLSLTYPMNGKLYNEIQNDRIIVAIPFKGGTKQAFRIYNIVDDLDGTIEVLANHISYDANFIPIKQFTATGITEAIAGFYSNNLEPNKFTITAPGFDNETTVYEQLQPRSLRACLGGDERSLLDTFSSRGHGEYEWDNFSIKFHYDRGTDNGFYVRYAKNLVDYQREQDSTDLITGAVAYYIDDEYGVPYCGDVQHNSLYDVWPVKKTVVIDATEDFNAPPSREDLNTYARVYAEALGQIEESIEVDFTDVNQSDKINLCDTVRVYYGYYYNEQLIKVVDYQSKIVKTVWDVLKGRYERITIGSNRSSLSDTLTDKITKAQESAVQSMNNKIISVVQDVNTDLGVITNSVSSLEKMVVPTLTDIAYLYLVTDGTTPNQYADGWDIVYPVLEEGQRVWRTIQYTYTGDIVVRSDPEDVTKEGVTMITPEYYMSTSSETQEGGEWVEDLPPIVDGYFLWTRERYDHEDTSVTYSDPVLSSNAKINIINQAITMVQQTDRELIVQTSRIGYIENYMTEQTDYLKWALSTVYPDQYCVLVGSTANRYHTEVRADSFAVVDGQTDVMIASANGTYIRSGVLEVGSGEGSYTKIGRYKWLDEGDLGFSLIYEE